MNDMADLKERIEQEIRSLKKEALENVFDDLVKGLKFCIDIVLARKFYRFFKNLHFIFFFSNIKLVYNNTCSVAMNNLSPALW